MKQIITTGLALLLLTGSLLAESPLILDENFGLTETLEVVSYDNRQKTVDVDNGLEISSRTLDSFSDLAQKEILAWVADENFLSSSKLRVEIDEDVRRVDYSVDPTYGEIQIITYLVELENEGDVGLGNVEIECQVFYESTKDEWTEKRKKIFTKTFSILPGKKAVFKSDRVRLLDLKTRHSDHYTETTIYYGKQTVYNQDKLLGVRFLVRRTDRNGNIVTREFETGRPPAPSETSDFIYYREPENTQITAAEKKKEQIKVSKMVRVDGGKFLRNGVVVELDSFWIGSHEATQRDLVRVFNKGLVDREIKGEDWQADAWISLRGSGEDLVRKNSKSAPHLGGIFYSDSAERVEASIGDDFLPAIKSTWYGAVYYCNALSREEGLTPCYKKGRKEWECDFSANGYRLPTEAEWEYAARGGASGSVKDYSGSDNLDEVGWYEANCKDGEDPLKANYGEPNRAHPIGDKRPNELGLYDMSGNAPEWCNDWYGEYSDDPESNPIGYDMPRKRKEQFHVIRGGGWNSPKEKCRVSVRSKGYPEEDTAGFRVVRSISKKDQ